MNKLAKYIIGIAVAAAIIFLVWYFGNIVTYILVAAVLAIIGKPLVSFLTKLRIKGRHIPKWLAALITLIAIWAVAITFFSIFIPLVFGKLNELSSFDMGHFISSFREPLSSLQRWIEDVFGVSASQFSITDAISNQLPKIINPNVINNILSSIVSIIGNTVIALFSITFITFFFLKEDHLFMDMVVSVFPSKYEDNVTRAMDSVTRLLVRYFTGILAESTIMMLIVSVGLLCFGFPASTAFFMGLIVGILNVIPYVGPIISACFCILMGVLSPVAGWAPMAMVFIIGGVIIFAQGIDNFILQPVLYSNRVYAHPLEIFIVLLIAGSVAGVLGMLLAIPAYTVIRVFAKEFFNNFKLVQKLTEKI